MSPWWSEGDYFVHTTAFLDIMREAEEAMRRMDELSFISRFGEPIKLTYNNVNDVLWAHEEVFEEFGYWRVKPHIEFYDKMIRKFWLRVLKPLRRHYGVKYLPERVIVDMFRAYLGWVRYFRSMVGKYRKKTRIKVKAPPLGSVVSPEEVKRVTVEYNKLMSEFIEKLGVGGKE